MHYIGKQYLFDHLLWPPPHVVLALIPPAAPRYAAGWSQGRAVAVLSALFGVTAAVAELIGGQAAGYAFASIVAV